LKPEKVFKRYDIRGKYPEEIDNKFAKLLGKSLGTFVAQNLQKNIVVCRDNKPSSETLKQSLISGIMSSGVNVIDVGIGPTDYAAFCGKKLEAVSVEVTSSHMPLEFNGFKFMYPEGNGFINKDLYAVQDIFRDREFQEGVGHVSKKNMKDNYTDSAKTFARQYAEDWDKKIVVDSLGGTGKILPGLLRDLGAEVIDLSKGRKGIYHDPPAPQPKNLDELKQAVIKNSADLGISNDLDSDRITVYYKGRFLKGSEVFCILSQLVKGPVVASIDTSKVLEEFLEVEYTRVGDPFVMDHAIDIDAELAGEPNGHYSFTDFVPYNSGILTALIISGLDINKSLERIPDYAVMRHSVKVERKEELLASLKQSIDDENILSDLDGIKFCRNNAEILVRPSGSSQKVRIISESPDPESAKEVLEDVRDKIEGFRQKG